jgi:hypothetical protein
VKSNRRWDTVQEVLDELIDDPVFLKENKVFLVGDSDFGFYWCTEDEMDKSQIIGLRIIW